MKIGSGIESGTCNNNNNKKKIEIHFYSYSSAVNDSLLDILLDKTCHALFQFYKNRWNDGETFSARRLLKDLDIVSVNKISSSILVCPRLRSKYRACL